MPKVVFKKMSLEDNITFIKDIFNDKDGILDAHTYTVSLFPELKAISLNSPKEIIDKTICEVVTKHYNNYDKFDDDIKRYTDAWNKYNDKFFDALTKYLNAHWPIEHNTICVTVGIIPVCPRYLDDFSFSVHEDINDDQLIETCAHELCHFLWFEKWKMLYPNSNLEDFESPHIIWEYSEMIVDVILNSSEINKVFNGKKTRYCYDYFYESNDYKSIMNKLFDVFKEDISIEEKITKGYDYIKRKVPK